MCSANSQLQVMASWRKRLEIEPNLIRYFLSNSPASQSKTCGHNDEPKQARVIVNKPQNSWCRFAHLALSISISSFPLRETLVWDWTSSYWYGKINLGAYTHTMGPSRESLNWLSAHSPHWTGLQWRTNLAIWVDDPNSRGGNVSWRVIQFNSELISLDSTEPHVIDGPLEARKAAQLVHGNLCALRRRAVPSVLHKTADPVIVYTN